MANPDIPGLWLHSAGIERLLALSVLGACAGWLACVWSVNLIVPEVATGLRNCRFCEAARSPLRQLLAWYPGIRCRSCRRADVYWPGIVVLLTSLLFAGFGFLLLDAGCQSVSEVQPSQPLWWNRLPFQLLFLFLMLTATLTDFLDYTIPDAIVFPGIAAALIWSTLSGELQIIHVWVNWDDDWVALYGPYLPNWMKVHQHLHGFVWSACGLLTGAGLTWLGRIAAHGILGVPAIGFGDVTLMAMAGAFLGWQPTLCAMAVAPLAGLVLGLGGRILTGRNFVAFGPTLCAGAVIVLCVWRFLWEDLRLKIIFSHWPTILGFVGGSFAVYCALLTILRVFRAIPGSRLR